MIRPLSLTLLLSFLLCVSVQVQGQDVWSLQRCIDHALETNLTLKQSRLNYQLSDIDLKQSQEARLPNFNASTNFNSNFGRSIDPVTNDFITQQFNSINGGISSGMPLFQGFQLSNTIKRNKLNLRASELDVKDAENTLMLNIAGSYLTILLNRELVEGAEVQLSSTQEQRDRTEKLVEAGTLARASLFDIESQIAIDETNLVNAKNQLALSYLILQQTLNLEPQADFVVEVPTLSDPSSPGVRNIEEIYAYAMAHQPNIESSQLQIKSAQKDIVIARGNYLPSLDLSGSIFTRYSSGQSLPANFQTVPFPVENVRINGENATFQLDGTRDVPTTTEKYLFSDQVNDNLSYGYGVGLSIPIFNRRQIRSGVDRATISLQRAQLNARQQELTLRQNIEQAHLDVLSAYSAFEQVNRQIRALELTFQNAEKQREVGLMNNVDFLVAKNNLERARTDRIRLKYDYIFKTKILDFYEGKTIEL